MEKNLKNKKKLFLSLGLLLVTLVLVNTVISMVFKSLGISELEKTNDIAHELSGITTRVLLSLPILLIVKKIYNIKIGFTEKNIGKGIFIYGFIILAYTGLQFFTEYAKPEKSIFHTLPILAIYLVANLCTGLLEEVLCRGLLFNSFKEYFGDNKKGVLSAAFISSAMFGAFHLLNLLSHPNLVIGTITQVFYAFFFGIAFCAIYYRSGNIIACIILHGLFDLSSDFWKIFAISRNEVIEASKSVDMTPKEGISVLLILSPLIITGLIQLNREFKKRNIALSN